jgi:hypothetical protein
MRFGQHALRPVDDEFCHIGIVEQGRKWPHELAHGSVVGKARERIVCGLVVYASGSVHSDSSGCNV